MLKVPAANINDSSYYKEFASMDTVHQPKLYVTFNAPPHVLSNLAPAANAVVDAGSFTLSAKYSDPEGQAGSIEFELYEEWDGTRVATGKINVASGATATWAPAVSSGMAYLWRARATDGTSHSEWYPDPADPMRPVSAADELYMPEVDPCSVDALRMACIQSVADEDPESGLAQVSPPFDYTVETSADDPVIQVPVSPKGRFLVITANVCQTPGTEKLCGGREDSNAQRAKGFASRTKRMARETEESDSNLERRIRTGNGPSQSPEELPGHRLPVGVVFVRFPRLGKPSIT